jgi:hypothetical protein
MLDSLHTVENKKLVLRVITVLSENTENTLEIGIYIIPFYVLIWLVRSFGRICKDIEVINITR